MIKLKANTPNQLVTIAYNGSILSDSSGGVYTAIFSVVGTDKDYITITGLLDSDYFDCFNKTAILVFDTSESTIPAGEYDLVINTNLELMEEITAFKDRVLADDGTIEEISCIVNKAFELSSSSDDTIYVTRCRVISDSVMTENSNGVVIGNGY